MINKVFINLKNKQMNFKVIYKALLLVSILLIISCGEDFITKEPLALESTNTFYDTEDNAIAAVTAIYSVMRAESGYSRNFWVFGDVASDDAEAGGEVGGGDQPNIQRIGRFTHGSSNAVCLEIWMTLYQGIYRASVVVEKVSVSTMENTTLRDRLVGEALFLRAKFHFDLMLIFGGIPVIDHVLGPSEMYQTRSPISAVFDQIEEDLLQAIDYLPNIYTDPMDNGRPSKGAAKALLAKAYVFESSYNEIDDPNAIYEGLEDRWEDARVLAEDVITNASTYGYGLDPDYEHIFRVAGESSSEHIFKVNGANVLEYDGAGLSDGEPGWNAGIGINGNVYQTCRNYIAATGVSTYSNLGWGFNCPTQDLYDAFDEGDKRREWVIVTTDDTMQLAPGGPYYNYDPTAASPTGYNHAKYTPLPQEWAQKTSEQAGPLDVKCIRYADLLLLAAEANFKRGNVARATDLVNMVRTRARVWGGGTVPANYPAGSVTLNQIWLERRLELSNEGHRFFDLVRTGRAYNKLNGFYCATTGDNLIFEKGTHEYFPIPEAEITLSQNNLVQNPGYN